MRLVLLSNAFARAEKLHDFVPAELSELYSDAETVLVLSDAATQVGESLAKSREIIRQSGREAVFLPEASDQKEALNNARALYVDGGNVFRLTEALHAKGLLGALRGLVRSGVPYAGASAGAGAVVAGPTIAATNSMPIVLPASLEALGFTRFHINVLICTSTGRARWGVAPSVRLHASAECAERSDSSTWCAVDVGTLIT